ncbi:MAG: glycosyltransferase, partial [Planctomycetes bacterium]|nr:glycosyltransferase [Planctomycetota bacterium]
MRGVTAPRLSDLPPPPQGRTGWPWTAESRRLPLTTASGRPWPRISIVTPSFNQGRFIEQTIRSVLLQGYPNLEYVVMDGGSRDESLRAIRRYEAWIDHVASEPDRGQYDALNRGFHRCTGGVMGWLNSDDFYLPDALWAVGGAFADLGDVQWLVGTSSFAGEDGVACNPCNLRPVDTVCIRAGLHDGRVSPWVKQESTFWRRELWEAVGGRLDDAMRAAGDFDLWLRMSRHAELCFLRHP